MPNKVAAGATPQLKKRSVKKLNISAPQLIASSSNISTVALDKVAIKHSIRMDGAPTMKRSKPKRSFRNMLGSRKAQYAQESKNPNTSLQVFADEYPSKLLLPQRPPPHAMPVSMDDIGAGYTRGAMLQAHSHAREPVTVSVAPSLSPARRREGQEHRTLHDNSSFGPFRDSGISSFESRF